MADDAEFQIHVTIGQTLFDTHPYQLGIPKLSKYIE